MLKQVHYTPRMNERNETCKYCSIGQPQQCPAYGKKCSGCRKQDHLKVVCKLMWQQHLDCSGLKVT